MFKPKDKKPEVKVEEPKKITTLEDLINGYKVPQLRSHFDVVQALIVLKDAVKQGQIRHTKHSTPLNDIGFCFNISQQEAEDYKHRMSGTVYGQGEIQRVRTVVSLDNLHFVDAVTLNKEKICKLKADLHNATEAQKSKVAEIEKLAKKLGELEK